MRNLAKSLHTITSLTMVARHVWATENPAMEYTATGIRYVPRSTAEQAVEQAAEILGLAGMPDVYGLKAKAAAQLAKGS